MQQPDPRIAKGQRGGQGSNRWAFLTWFVIKDRADHSQVYLKRLRIIQTPWFALYLHFIYLEDRDRDPHDHPWWFGSFVVRGGYTEAVWRTTRFMDQVNSEARLNGCGFGPRYRTWRRFSWHTTPLDLCHQITKVEPGTITLLFVGRRQRQWGFFTDDGWVPWPEYVQPGENSFV